MTGPTSGFPDWQQYASWRGSLAIDDAPNVAAGAAFGIGSFAMGNYASVRVRITTSVGRTEIVMLGEDDPFGAGQHLIKRWIASTDTSVHCVIPVPTTYVEFEGTADAALGWQGTISVQPVNVATDKVHYYGYNSIVTAENIVINAGVTHTYYPVVMLPGPAHFWGATNVAGVDVIHTAQTYDRNGVTEHRIATFRQFPAIGANIDFEIPERAWRMTVFNNTGAAQTYFFAVASRANLT